MIKRHGHELNVGAFRRSLLKWYRANARDLPWRRTTDAYAVWLSEIILQQTRVDQGLPYYERFIAAFPTVHALAEAKGDRVLKLWEGLGYYSRARNLHCAAKLVVSEHDGAFPKTETELRSLPGVGRYTAGAIASIAFDERVPVLDGNVIRVLSRVYNVPDCTDTATVRERLWELAEALVPATRPGDFNQAMMELGATICSPTAPQCTDCPVLAHCAAHRDGVQHERPVRKAKRPTPRHEMVAAAIARNGRYLFARRPANGLLGGLWELPSDRVKKGETHQRALVRALRDQFGVRIKTRGTIARVQHAYSHFKVSLHVYTCEIVDGQLEASNHDELRWIARSQFDRFAFPKVVHKFIASL